MGHALELHADAQNKNLAFATNAVRSIDRVQSQLGLTFEPLAAQLASSAFSPRSVGGDPRRAQQHLEKVRRVGEFQHTKGCQRQRRSRSHNT